MCTYHFHPLQCIVPPYMIARLLNNTSERRAVFTPLAETLIQDEKFRGKRKAFSQLSDEAKRAVAIPPLKDPDTAVTPYREVYSAENKEVQPGKLVRKEGEPAVADTDVNNVYDAAGCTWDFYYSLFGRNSIDNSGLKLIQTVHFGVNYQNAFWDGEQMVYGDGDGRIFSSFTTDIDIIGHELTHGVIQNEVNLVYQNQSGALNESLADVFGIMIKQKALNQDVHASDWLIGENVLIGKDYAIRSLKAPGTAYVNHPLLGTDPQPAHMKNYTNDPYDYGGVHLNSGIPNHAFYLAAVTIGGYAWEKAGKIWYAAMRDKERVKINATFAEFKEATLYHAREFFAEEPSIEKAVANAWNAVGV